MADITLPYHGLSVPPLSDASVFSANLYNQCLHTGANAVALYTEVNGRVEDANFEAAMRIRPEHIRPFATFRAGMDGMTEGMDVWDDQFPRGDTPDNYVVVPGLTRRFYIPFVAALVTYQWSVFYSVYRMREDNGAAPEIYLQAFIDEVNLAHSKRRCPRTLHLQGNDPKMLEGMLTRHYDGYHQSTNVAAGLHQLSFRILMPPNDGDNNIDLGTFFTAADMDMWHRVHFGIRQARAVAML